MSLDLPANFEEFVNSTVRGTIKLSDFSNIFFPMFVAYFNGEEGIEVGRWLTTTGTKGYEWVDVIQAGEVVMSVPPLLQSITNNLSHQLRQDPGDILHVATLKDKTIPGAGNRHIRDNITNVLDLEDDHDEGQAEFIKHWVPIFEYYGYGQKDNKTKTDSIKDEYNPEDFSNYDEL